MKRKTPEDYHKLAESRQYKWLGPEVSSVDIKTIWQCQSEHTWDACYDKIRSGRGCPHCSNRASKTPDDYRELATERGFKWLGPQVSTTLIKTLWQCENEHKWVTAYKSIRKGNGCPHCSRKIPKTTQDYYDLANEADLEWLGEELPTNSRIKTTWQCIHNHKWDAPYSGISSGHGCPYCAKKAKKTVQDYYSLAVSRDFEWLGPEVTNASIKTGWRCKDQHEWETSFSEIQSGSGCRECAGLTPKDSTDYERLAEKHNVEWLGPEVPNVLTKTWWQCSKYHKWEKDYNSIRHQGIWCQSCKTYRGEEKISEILNMLNITYERQKRFEYCRNIKPLPFDFSFRFKDEYYLVEYQGIQHYQPIDYFGGEQALLNNQTRDKIKAKFAKDNGYNLIIIPYTEFDNIEPILIDWLNSIQNNPGGMDNSPKGISQAYRFDGEWHSAVQLEIPLD